MCGKQMCQCSKHRICPAALCITIPIYAPWCIYFNYMNIKGAYSQPILVGFVHLMDKFHKSKLSNGLLIFPKAFVVTWV